mgnify:CR=1 FL=1
MLCLPDQCAHASFQVSLSVEMNLLGTCRNEVAMRELTMVNFEFERGISREHNLSKLDV